MLEISLISELGCDLRVVFVSTSLSPSIELSEGPPPRWRLSAGDQAHNRSLTSLSALSTGQEKGVFPYPLVPLVLGYFVLSKLNARSSNRFPSLRSMSDVTTTPSARCEALISAFEAGTTSRVAATLAIYDILAEPSVSTSGVAGPIPTAEEIEKFMEPYMDRCDQWVRDQEKAKARGKK
ncbi:hypothetical protein K438DRAFT_1762985 [Mycena galopus ATCC 62051]|nr:hypothetical protein K438DRAFT_1762985 [Mycena galopus ATCC 62051]